MSRKALAELGRSLTGNATYAGAVESWPAPIAYELHTLRRLLSSIDGESDAAAILLQTRDVAEVLVKIPVLMMAADRLASGAGAQIARGLFRQVTLGHWVETARHLAAQGRDGLFPELVELAGSRGQFIKAISAYLPHRNAAIGHGAFRPDSDETAREVLRHLGGGLNGASEIGVLDAVWAMSAWGGWDALRLELDPLDDDEAVPPRDEADPPPDPPPPNVLSGADTLALTRPPGDTHSFLHRRNLTLSDGESRRLPLGGLLAARRCRECRHLDVFQYDSTKPDLKAFTFLDYARGHPLRAGANEAIDLAAYAAGLSPLDDTGPGDGYRAASVINLLEQTLDAEPLLLRPDWAHQELDNFLGRRDRGILWIEAPADVGKTTFVRDLFARCEAAEADRWVIPVLFRRDFRSTSGEFAVGLTRKLWQLIEQKGDREDFGALPQISDKSDNRRKALAAALAATRALMPDGDKPILLVLDGLDETEVEGNGASVLDFVPRPVDLPSGVYIILTSRPPGDCPEHVRRLRARLGEAEGLDTFSLSLDDDRYRGLLARYVRERLTLTHAGLREDDLSRLALAIPERAAGVFLSVSFLTDRLRAALPDGAHRTPSSIETAINAFLADTDLGGAAPKALFGAYFEALVREAGGDAKLADEMGFVLAALAACERAWTLPLDPNIGRFSVRGDPVFAHDETFPGVPLDALALALDRMQDGAAADGSRPYRPRFALSVYRLRALVATNRDAGRNAYALRLKGLRDVVLMRPALSGLVVGIHSRIADAVRRRADRGSAEATADPVLRAFSPRWMEHDLLARLAIDTAALTAWWRENGDRARDLIDRQAADPAGAADLWRGEQARAGFRAGLAHLSDGMAAAADVALTAALALAENRAAPSIRAARALARQALGDVDGWREDMSAALSGADFGSMADETSEAWFEMEADRSELEVAAGRDPGAFVLSALTRVRERLARPDVSRLLYTSAARLKEADGRWSYRAERHRRAIDDYTAAINWRSKAVDGAALGEAWTLEYRNDLAGAHVNRGNAKYSLGDFAGAIADHGVAIVLMVAIRAAMGEAWTLEYRNDLASAHMNRGNAKYSLADLAGAIADHGVAIVLMEAIRAAMGEAWTLEYRNDLANAHVNRGVAMKSLGDFAGAIADYGVAIVLREAIRAAMGEAWTLKYRNDLALAQMGRGNAKSSLGDFAGAIADYGVAIVLMVAIRAAMGEAWTLEYRNDLASAHVNRGVAKSRLGDFAGALADYGVAIVLREAIRAAMGEAWTLEYRNDLASAHMNRGVAKRNLGDFAGAIADYGVAIVLMEAIRAAMGEAWTLEYRNDLAGAYVNRGNAKRSLGDFAGAIVDYDRADGLLASQAAAPPGADAWIFRGKYYSAQRWLSLRRPAFALGALETALAHPGGDAEERAGARALRDQIRAQGTVAETPPSGAALEKFFSDLAARDWRETAESARARGDRAAERAAPDLAPASLPPAKRAAVLRDLIRLDREDGRPVDALARLEQLARLRLQIALESPKYDTAARLAVTAARDWVDAALALGDEDAVAHAWAAARLALDHGLTLEPDWEDYRVLNARLTEAGFGSEPSIHPTPKPGRLFGFSFSRRKPG